MIPSYTARQSKKSSVLVITLLGIVLLTIIVLAFMKTMSLGLTTSKSYLDIRRATLAAQAGLDTAIAQITLASGTNLAFVTGLTNYSSGTINYPLTVIGAGNLTNFDQVMPLVSGPLSYLTNFGAPGFANNFTAYAALRLSGSAAQTVDVNTPYQFIEDTNIVGAPSVNVYQAPWVTLTNVVGSQVTYTRYAYVVLDDSARMNPTLMTGAGTGFTDPTNWYTGPQDINATYLTNNGSQLLTASQLAQITNAVTSFGSSDATLGETFSSRTAYEAVKVYFTSQTNASYDVIPAWMPNGGMPKYNLNDLATNTAYGASPLARAQNIASIITNNLPNFYMRDAAMNATNTARYVNRLAANLVTYISPDGTWPASEYTTNTSGISPQVYGVFPVAWNTQVYAPTGGQGVSTNAATVAITYWLSFWNPYTTPVPLTNVVLHVYHAPGWYLGTGPTNWAPTNYVGTNFYCSDPGKVAKPNEFVTLGFTPVTNSVTSPTTVTSGPQAAVDAVNNGGDAAPWMQFSVSINGQTVAQTQNLPNICGLLQDPVSAPPSPTNAMVSDSLSSYGSEVGDPRFLNYMYSSWPSTHDEYNAEVSFNGFPNTGGSALWNIFPGTAAFTGNTWANRDVIARSPANPGANPVNNTPNGAASPWTETPGQLPYEYSQSTDSNAAPEVFRNGPMVSIGELGHVFDPAYANDSLTAVDPRQDGGNYQGSYGVGGGRSLRIGAPEYTGSGVNYTTVPALMGWNVDGERAIDLLDLFTINNENTNAVGQTNSIYQSMTQGGALGRININTASSNVLASVFSQVQITSDPGMTNSSGSFISPVTLDNIPSMVSNVIANRPYSSLSDLYKITPLFDTNANYYPNLPIIPAHSWSDGGIGVPFTYPTVLNVFNRVHQEAFGKLVQHVTVQSRAYRIYVIGQVLDSSQNPHGSVAMEVGVNLQYNPTEAQYNPVIQYLRLLK